MRKDNVLYVKQKQSTFAIRLDTILYMEKSKRIITVHITDGKPICFYGRYDAVMPMLDERFTHPHESYVINMQHISRLGNQEVVMLGGQKIDMGGRCFGRLRQAYEDYVRNRMRSGLES